jgi:hypothetical protein
MIKLAHLYTVVLERAAIAIQRCTMYWKLELFTFRNLCIVFALVLTIGATTDTQAQGQQTAIVFTGRVVGKNAETLSKVYIFIPKAGRGVLSDETGFFALPVFPGDSILFSHLTYQRQYHIIPRRLAEESYSALVMLKEDVKTLKEVRIYPYSTEEEFKKAFLEMKLPDDISRENLERSTRPDYLMRMAAITPMSAASNFRMFMDQQQYGRDNVAYRSNMTTLGFNPFAWANLFKSIKNGEFKSKEYRQILNQMPRENVSRKDLMKGN